MPWRELISHKLLLRELSLRLLKAPFRASKLGWVWLVLQPMLMMALYTIVFAKIFGGRYGDSSTETVWDYGIGVYLSLTVFSFAADVIGGAPTILETHRSMLRRSAVPASVIVTAQVIAAALRFIPNLILSLLTVAIFSTLHASVLWAVPGILGFALFLLGIAYALSALGAVYADVRHLAGLVSTILLWSSAVFYSASKVPAILQYVNPVLQAVELTRAGALWGVAEPSCFRSLGVLWISAAVSLTVGVWLMRRLRTRFTE